MQSPRGFEIVCLSGQIRSGGIKFVIVRELRDLQLHGSVLSAIQNRSAL